MSRPLLAFYGDDFTGSADAMEVLQWSGIRTVLFLQPPTEQQLNRFDQLRAFGVAGWSRTMSPEEMQTHLKPALECVKASGAKLVHYKTCSTFDSSPQVGSIGKTLELGREVFASSPIPMVVGAPNLGRYQVFGNLFARSGLDSLPYRLDRHPTMRRHPITPMDEADLRRHLASQTDLQIDLVDVLRLSDPNGEILAGFAGSDVLLFDVLSPSHLATIGRIVCELAEQAAPKFIVGSSGVEYALTAHWAETGELASLQSHAPSMPTFPPTAQLFAITGSCSPVNARQIDSAIQHGFEEIAIDTPALADPSEYEGEIQQVVARALDRLRAGANVIVHSSRGPEDPRVRATQQRFEASGLSEFEIRLRSGRILGPRLGQILKQILSQHPLMRVGVAGGDTSGYVAGELGLTALEAIASVAPGSPLCRGTADNDLDGVEFFFKGGQVGKDDVWTTMLRGTATQ